MYNVLSANGRHFTFVTNNLSNKFPCQTFLKNEKNS